MGQCASNKAKGNLSVKKILLHKNKHNKKMDKHHHKSIISKEQKTDDNYKIYPSSSINDDDSNNKKNNKKCSKGVAMSFGFKRRPTPMSNNTKTLAWQNNGENSSCSSSDSNGNNKPIIDNNDEHKTTKINNLPLLNSASSSAVGNRSRSESRCTSSNLEYQHAINRSFTRNVTIITRTEVTESVNNKPSSSSSSSSAEKLTITRLPKPSENNNRLIETKTAKTIANNQKKSAKLLRDEFFRTETKQTPSTCNNAFEKNKKSFLKSANNNNNNRFFDRELISPHQEDANNAQEWINGGEAMAEDVSVHLNPPSTLTIRGKNGNNSPPNKLAISSNNHLNHHHHHHYQEDPKFSPLANNQCVTLLDDETLSPVESLLSSTENAEEVLINNNNNNKTKEKSSDSPSISLSEDKDDFLIDDEIADQPELIFEEITSNNNKPSLLFNSYNLDFSPLLNLRKKKFLKNNNSANNSYYCDSSSISSEDLMLDYNNTNITTTTCSSEMDTTPIKLFKINNNNNKNSDLSINNSQQQQIITETSSESLILSKANHSAIQQDIIGIRTMLLTLKRVLNESDTQLHLSLHQEDAQNCNINEIKLELADLRRQILFLQGQLEDKEKNVTYLQKQIEGFGVKEDALKVPQSLKTLLMNTSNAATQTERTSSNSGLLSLTTTPLNEDNLIFRYINNRDNMI